MTPTPPPLRRSDTLAALAWGVMITLCVTGYTFGQSNHHVYLLDALRLQQPECLAHDWFTTHTLQYHFLYTHLVIGLQKIGLLEAGFFVLYLVLVVAMHAAWLAIVRQLGGDLFVYLLGVLLYHLSGGGLGLGVYQFLQDGSFLPSNISSVATLVAIACWLDRRLIAAGVAASVAGLFHVNYAVLIVGAWGALSVWCWWRGERGPIGRYLAASVIALSPSLYNVALAGIEATRHAADIPMDEFVALYVRLRHAHHHDPLHWPLALWASFLWPIPLAVLAIRRMPPTLAKRRLNAVLVISLGLVVVAFLFAGVWFVSGTLVKLSLFRFSIFAKLITCTYAAWWMLSFPRGRTIVVAACGVSAIGLLGIIPLRSALPASIPSPQLGLLIGAALLTAGLGVALSATPRRRLRDVLVVAGLTSSIVFAARQQLGVKMPGEDDQDMRAVCAWARERTDRSALFLTPPQDSIFPYTAQRSTIVGFKHVPQLSAEIIEWKRRLSDVLAMDILRLPTPMPLTLRAIADQYTSLPPENLRKVAAEFECDYVVAMRSFDDGTTPVFTSPAGRYVVYRTSRLDNAAVQPTLKDEP